MARYYSLFIMGVLVPTLVSFPVVTAFAQDASKTKQGAAEPNRTSATDVVLKVGDVAPALDIEKWLRDAKVNNFEKNTVYVIEFWKTWKGRNLSAMLDITHVQATFASKNVRVIGITADDPTTSLPIVQRFIEKTQIATDVALAWDSQEKSRAAYMGTTPLKRARYSFIIDKEGKVAYAGSSNLLEDVVFKVVDGTWKGQEDADAIIKADEALNRPYQELLDGTLRVHSGISCSSNRNTQTSAISRTKNCHSEYVHVNGIRPIS